MRLASLQQPRSVCDTLSKTEMYPRTRAKALIERDQEEADEYGQRTRDTFHLADAFVRARPDDLRSGLWRCLDLIFGDPFVTPMPEENAMFLAYAASTRSGDLGRQVGAAVTSARGDVIAVGCNDVPRFGGGLYWPGEGDQRDLVENIGYDSNAKERDGIINEVMRRLRPRTKADQRQKKFRELMSESPLLDLTEYGRAVHAEMEALLACARSGVSPLGGTLYSTTFPCHNCTRHMVGAGLERVVFIEPYSKSRASQLHSDSIAMGEESDHATAGREAGSRLQFEPFVGIGPRRYFDLFSLKLSTGYPIERKSKESFLKATWNRRDCRSANTDASDVVSGTRERGGNGIRRCPWIDSEAGMTAKKSIRNTKTKENREYWKFVDGVVSDVATWPAWKRGGISRSSRDSR